MSVYDPYEREFFKVICNDLEYASGLSLALHQMILDHARRAGVTVVSVRELAMRRDNLRRWVENLMSERGGHSRRQAARILGNQGGHPVQQLALDAQADSSQAFAEQWAVPQDRPIIPELSMAGREDNAPLSNDVMALDVSMPVPVSSEASPGGGASSGPPQVGEGEPVSSPQEEQAVPREAVEDLLKSWGVMPPLAEPDDFQS